MNLTAVLALPLVMGLSLWQPPRMVAQFAAPPTVLSDLSSEINKDPKNARNYAARAILQLDLKDPQSALKDAESAVALEPSNSVYLALRGSINLELGNSDKALEDLSQAIKLDPYASALYQQRARIYSKLDKAELASADLDSAVKLSSQPTPGLLITAAAAKMELKQPKGALEYLDKAEPLVPKDDPVIPLLKSQARVMDGDYAGAVKEMDAVVALTPKSSRVYLQRAALLVELDRFDEALKDADEYVRLEPESGRALVMRGYILLEKKEYAKANQDFTKAIESDPKRTDAYLARGQLRIRERAFDKALEDANKVLTLQADHPSALLMRSDALGRQGKLDDALTSYDKLIALKVDRPNAYLGRALTLFKLGQYQRAQADAEYYCRHFSWKEKNSPYAAVMGYIAAVRAGDAKAGDALLREAKEKAGRDPWTDAIIAYVSGDFSSAELLKKATNNDQLTEAHTYIGLNEQRLSHAKEAEDSYRWVQDHGEKDMLEYDVVVSELQRLKSGSKNAK